MNWYVWVLIVLSIPEMHASWKEFHVWTKNTLFSEWTIMKPDFYVEEYDVYRTQIDAYFILLESLKCLLYSTRICGTKGFLEFKLYWFENKLLTWKTLFLVLVVQPFFTKLENELWTKIFAGEISRCLKAFPTCFGLCGLK